jgi:hypothetical protein
MDRFRTRAPAANRYLCPSMHSTVLDLCTLAPELCPQGSLGRVCCSVRARRREQQRLPGGLHSARQGGSVQERGCRRQQGVRRQWGVLVLPSRLLLAQCIRQRVLQHQRDQYGQLLRAAAVRWCGPTPIRTHTETSMHTHAHARAHARIHANAHTRSRIRKQCAYVCTHAHMYARMRTHHYVHAHARIRAHTHS